MKILFLTISRINDIDSRGIYSDLMREFMRRGNEVYIASPTERRFGKPTHTYCSHGAHILKVRTLNIQKTNIVEKGIGTLLLESQFDKAIRHTWPDVKFDMVLYSTPPITFNRVIERVKHCTGARSYLMLKDIFPQNAVDLGMMKEGSFIHRLFRNKEQRLYEISDKIGCMSPANCRYVIDNNPEVDPAKVELCPNAIEPRAAERISSQVRDGILNKYGVPKDKTLFLYGGNLGKPQGIDFLLEVVAENEKHNGCFITIVGSGTEFVKIKRWFDKHQPQNALLLSSLPKDEYDLLVSAADVGLIFLDRRFTIPNFPSRLLSYIENSMPILLATDTNTDMGKIAEQEGFGLWAESGDLNGFIKNMDTLTQNKDLIDEMGQRGRQFLIDNYTVGRAADIICKKLHGQA